jgi:hypothetical protein
MGWVRGMIRVDPECKWIQIGNELPPAVGQGTTRASISTSHRLSINRNVHIGIQNVKLASQLPTDGQGCVAQRCALSLIYAPGQGSAGGYDPSVRRFVAHWPGPGWSARRRCTLPAGSAARVKLPGFGAGPETPPSGRNSPSWAISLSTGVLIFANAGYLLF